MIGIVDRWLEKVLKKAMHKRRKKVIHKTIAAFIKKHNPNPDVVERLAENLQKEADRIYAIADQSILVERIKRARYTFWVTLIVSLIAVGILAVITHGTALVFIIPLITVVLAWAIALGTIPISYNQRIKGSMDAVVLAFEKTMVETTENKEDLAAIKNLLVEMNNRMKEVSEKVDTLYKEQSNNPNVKVQLDEIMGQAEKAAVKVADDITTYTIEHNKQHHLLKKLCFWKHKSHKKPKEPNTYDESNEYPRRQVAPTC